MTASVQSFMTASVRSSAHRRAPRPHADGAAARRRRTLATLLSAAAVVGLTTTVASAPDAAAQRAVQHPGVVPERPRTDTVRALDGEVADTEQLGNRIIIAGSFTQVRDVNGTVYQRKYLAAYDIDTGALDVGFDPVLDRPVNDVSPAPDGSALFVAGEFSVIDGVTRRKVAKLTPTGDLVAAFKANTDARVGDIFATPTRVFLGGRFNLVNAVSMPRLAAVNPTTGALDTSFNFPLSEGIGLAGPGGSDYTLAIDASADWSTLMVAHTARKVGGQPRAGIALFDIAGATATLKPWRTQFYDQTAAQFRSIYITSGAISADGSYVVTVHSGGDRPPAFDTAVKFPTNVSGDDVQPAWVTRLFDSLYAVAITDHAIYVGGHLAFAEAPGSIEPWPGDTNINYSYGVDERGPAQLGNQVVRRGHLAALNITTGKALPWDPGTDAFHGVVSLTAIPRGLLLGHDGNRIGGFSSIGRHGFFDFTRVPPAEDPDSTIDEPFNGQLLAGGNPVTLVGSAKGTAGVKRVVLEIIDKSSRYLQANGTFSTTYASRNATLVSPNATSTTWTATLPVIPASDYTVYARATDVANLKEPAKTQAKFTVRPTDSVAPVWTSLTPAGGTVFSTNSFTMTGALTDNEAVASVRTSFYRTATKEYLQANGTLGPTYYEFSHVLSAPDTPSTTTTLPVANLPDGYWYTTTSARDRSGTIARQYYGYTVALGDLSPPTLSTNMPTDGATLNNPVTITATTTDDLGLDYAMVYLYQPMAENGVTLNGGLGAPGYWRKYVDPKGAKSATLSWALPELPSGTWYGYVYAYDLPGRQTYQFINFTVRKPGDALPTGTIQSPGAYTNQSASRTFTVNGTATDDLGVTKLRIRVRQAGAPYLHLQADGSWAVAVAVLDRPVDSPGATSTSWSFPLTVVGDATYYVWVEPVDTAGQIPQYTGSSYVYFYAYLGDAKPSYNQTSPTPNQAFTGGKVVMSGTASDDKGVAKVLTYIYNTASGQGPRPDGTYGALVGWYQIPIGSPGATSTTYSYTTPVMPAGTYVVYTAVEDSVGMWTYNYVYATVT